MIIENISKLSIDELNTISSQIIGCAIEVHKELGAGLLELKHEVMRMINGF